MSNKSRFIRRSLVLSLIIALVAVMLPTDAYARHVRIRGKNSLASSFGDVTPPDRFVCYWFEEEVHQYVCAGRDGINDLAFVLADSLNPGPTPPNADVVNDLAIPDKFSCRYTGDPAGVRSPELFACTYRHKHSRHGRMHEHRFLLSEAVFVTLEDDPSEPLPDPAVWVVPHPVKKKAHHAAPVADSHSH